MAKTKKLAVEDVEETVKAEEPPKMSDDLLPDLPIEDFEIPEEVDESVESTHNGSLEVALIGSGQGGSRLAEAFYRLGYKKCLVVNTAKHDLHHIDVPEDQKFHMAIDTAGAGKNMDTGSGAAKQHEQEIYNSMLKIFGKTDRILVTVGAGGGTGGGSCETLVALAKKYLTYIGISDVEKKVGVMAAMPTAGECASPNVAKNATSLLTNLAELADTKQISPLIVVDNDKIKKLYPRLTVKKFWPTVNSTIAGLYHTFNVITTHSSAYTTFDPADYDSILSLHGCMIMGCTTVKDPSSATGISGALKSNLEKTLLAGGFDLSTAKGVGAVVVGGEDIFENVEGLMDSIEYGFDTVANLVGNALVHRGIYEMGSGRLRVYTLVCGLDKPSQRIQELTKFHR